MNKLPKTILFFGLIVGISLLVMFILTMRLDPHGNTDWVTLANFGEAATVVAAIWALAAVLLAYQTLDAQRNEFKKASERFSTEQKQNISTYRQSSFQNGFFILLDRQREIADTFLCGTFQGQQALQAVQTMYERKYSQRRRNNSAEDKHASCKVAESETQTDYPATSHYARSLYHLVKFVDTFAEESKQRGEDFNVKQFMDLIQAQMSKWELFLTLVNCYNHDRMLQLIKKYNLVENLKCNPSVFEEMEAREVAISLGVRIKD